jgi:putative endonuclease
MPYAYMLECADDSYYVGSTWQHIETRVWQHNNDDEGGAAYTRRRRPVTLVWAASFDSMIEAFAFEKRVQGWSRKKREALIRGDYDALIDLSRRKAVQERAAAERERER